ncbi:hypothetical protein SNEBB_005053 [Seison nebaliae]|nr:hypothetical protein SNEBB_005053 [Seison nebaliae]
MQNTNGMYSAISWMTVNEMNTSICTKVRAFAFLAIFTFLVLFYTTKERFHLKRTARTNILETLLDQHDNNLCNNKHLQLHNVIAISLPALPSYYQTNIKSFSEIVIPHLRMYSSIVKFWYNWKEMKKNKSRINTSIKEAYAWRIRIYHNFTGDADFEKDLLQLISTEMMDPNLIDLCDIRFLPVLKDHLKSTNPSLWPFIGIADPSVNRILFRRIETFPTQRELFAVIQWMISQRTWHAVYDTYDRLPSIHTHTHIYGYYNWNMDYGQKIFKNLFDHFHSEIGALSVIGRKIDDDTDLTNENANKLLIELLESKKQFSSMLILNRSTTHRCYKSLYDYRRTLLNHRLPVNQCSWCGTILKHLYAPCRQYYKNYSTDSIQTDKNTIISTHTKNKEKFSFVTPGITIERTSPSNITRNNLKNNSLEYLLPSDYISRTFRSIINCLLSIIDQSQHSVGLNAEKIMMELLTIILNGENVQMINVFVDNRLNRSNPRGFCLPPNLQFGNPPRLSHNYLNQTHYKLSQCESWLYNQKIPLSFFDHHYEKKLFDGTFDIVQELFFPLFSNENISFHHPTFLNQMMAHEQHLTKILTTNLNSTSSNNTTKLFYPLKYLFYDCTKKLNITQSLNYIEEGEEIMDCLDTHHQQQLKIIRHQNFQEICF